MRAKCCFNVALGMLCMLYMYNHGIPTVCGYDFHCTVSNQVKFYCDIRLAFVKKDNQLVYRYNSENNKNKKLKLKKKTFNK